MAEPISTGNHSSRVVRWLDQVPLSHPQWKDQHPPSISDPWVLAIMASDSVGTADPWDWSIDRVIQELSTTTRSWEPILPRSMPPASFISTLCTDNLIDGSVLLNELNEDALREFIKPLAWRGYVRNAISQLRERSAEYNKIHNAPKRNSRWSLILSEFQKLSNLPYTQAEEVEEVLTRGELNELDAFMDANPEHEERVMNYLERRRAQRGNRRTLLRLPSSSQRLASEYVGELQAASRASQGTTLVSEEPGHKRQKLDTPNTPGGSTLINEELPHGIASSPAVPADHPHTEAHNHTPTPSSHNKRKRSASPEQEPSTVNANVLTEHGNNSHEEDQAGTLLLAAGTDEVTPPTADTNADAQLPATIPPKKEKKRGVLIQVGPPTEEGLANLAAQRAELDSFKNFMHGFTSAEASKESTKPKETPKDAQDLDTNSPLPTTIIAEGNTEIEGKPDKQDANNKSALPALSVTKESMQMEETSNGNDADEDSAVLPVPVAKEKKRLEPTRIGSPTVEGLADLEADRAEVVDMNIYIHGPIASPELAAESSLAKADEAHAEHLVQEQEVTVDFLPSTKVGKVRPRPKAPGRRRRRATKESVGSFLPGQKFPVDKVFYEDTEFGQNLANSHDETAFSFSHQPTLPGQSIYVNNCLKFSMLRKPQTFVDGDKSFTVIRPYPEKLLYASDSPVFLLEPSCTVFHKDDDGEVYAERGMVRSYPELVTKERELQGAQRQRRPGYGWPKPKDHSLSDSDGNHASDVEDAMSEHEEVLSEPDGNAALVVAPPVYKTYRGLLHPKRTVLYSKETRFLFGTTERLDADTLYRRILEKYSSQDEDAEPLPVFGDSGSENEYDARFWREIGKEKSDKAMQAMRRLKKKSTGQPIPSHEVSKAIDEGLAKIQRRWELKNLPKLQAKAWSLWTEARKGETLDGIISLRNRDLEKFNRNLAKLRDEFMAMAWSSQSEVLRLCGTLEGTVFNINDAKWKISTLQDDSPPPQPAEKPLKPKQQSAKVPAVKQAGQEGGIEDDDQEAADLDGFIVPDDDEEFVNQADMGADLGPDPDADADNEIEQDEEPQDGITLPSSPNKSRISTGELRTPTKKRRYRSKKMSGSHHDESSDSPAPASNSPSRLKTPSKVRRSASRRRVRESIENGQEVNDLTATTSPKPGDRPGKPIDLVTPEKSESDKKQTSTPRIKIRLTNSKSPFGQSRQSSQAIQGNIEMPEKDNLPSLYDPAAINRYSFAAWAKLFDEERIVVKALCNLSRDRRISLFSHISNNGLSSTSRDKFFERMKSVVLALNNGQHSKLGMKPADFEMMEQFIRLFHIFVDAHNGQYLPLDPDLTKIGKQNTILLNVLQGDDEFFEDFWKICCKMEEYFVNYESEGSRPSTPSPNKALGNAQDNKRTVNQDDSEDSERPRSSAKRRRLQQVIDSDDDVFGKEPTPSPSATRLELITKKATRIDDGAMIDEDSMLLDEEYMDEGDESSYLSLKRPRESSPSDSEALVQMSPKHKRKKQVHQDSKARARRQQDKEQQSQQDERRQKLQAKLVRSGRNEDLDLARLIINATDDPESAIRVHDHIAGLIKPHQIDGVRFLWNQIVTPGDDNLQGCLLAHTMGLGKTMQTITVLVAIAEASASINPSISCQVPKSLQVSKTLILCPPSLIDNWHDELLTWVPEDILGQIRRVDSSVTNLLHRADIISHWFEEGGVLLMGYSLFKAMAGEKSGFSDTKKQLLEGPNIVVADEAHHLKNSTSIVGHTVLGFRTKSRIALTGSPMANNLKEYYSLINFVAPGYLGPFKEFKDTYMEPISAGLYEESTPYERRRSFKMIKILESELGPKVSRADMLVLKDDLPKKKEFVITVPLTPIQTKAYTLYVQSMKNKSEYSRTKSGAAVQSTMWAWLNLVALLCNHPACFKSKLEERKEDARKTLAKIKANADTKDIGANTDADEDADEAATRVKTDPNLPLYKCGVSEDLIFEELRLFREEVDDISAIELSNKMVLLCQILDFAKAAGDKTLVFSNSIPTLNYLSRLFKRQKRRFYRLDGSTAVSVRQQMTKDFNNDQSDDIADFFLISTAAGGLGLNLQGANRVVILDFRFDPTEQEQAVGRAYRIGQKKETFVYRFVAGGTCEVPVLNKAVFKTQLTASVVDKVTPIAHAKKSLTQYLSDPEEVPQLDLSSSQGKDPLVLDKILAMQGQTSLIRGIVAMDTFNIDSGLRLTAEEEREVRQQLFENDLRRTNPQKYVELQRKVLASVIPPPPVRGRASSYQFNAAAAQSMQSHGQSPYPTLPRQPLAPMGNGFGTEFAQPRLTFSSPMPALERIRIMLDNGRKLQEFQIPEDAPLLRFQEIRSFMQLNLGSQELGSLRELALKWLKNDPSLCHKILTSEVSVDDFMHHVLNDMRLPESSSSKNGHNGSSGQVGTPQTSQNFSKSPTFSAMSEVVKSQALNNNPTAFPQPAIGSQIGGSQTGLMPVPARPNSFRVSKYDDWDTEQLRERLLLRYEKKTLTGIWNNDHALIQACIEWDEQMKSHANYPTTPVKQSHAASRAVTPEHEATIAALPASTSPTKPSFDSNVVQNQ